jgi:hypothetical protein
VGKHHAGPGASVHPIVADALTARTRGAGGVHAADAPHAEGESGIGWPAPPAPGGGGVGWPGYLATDEATDEGTADGAAQPVVRRGWRRLFGSSRAA